MQGLRPFVAVDGASFLGYADCQSDGLIDHFFVHHQHQRQGVGNLLMARIEEHAGSVGIEVLTSNVSITARPFFERHGFSVVRQQQVEVRGESLTNFRMSRTLQARFLAT